MWSCNPTPRHTYREKHILKRHMHPNVHSSTIYNSKTWKQPKCPSTDEGIENMWYTYRVENYSLIKHNEIMCFSAIWMDMEIIMLCKVSQRQISYDSVYMWNLKDGIKMNLHRKQTHSYQKGKARREL